jgi:hypothetical protein
MLAVTPLIVPSYLTARAERNTDAAPPRRSTARDSRLEARPRPG